MIEVTTPMHNPPHPGGFLQRMFMSPLNLSVRSLAMSLGVSPTTVSRIVAGQARVTPELAIRLEKALGRSAESWLRMQDAYDLANARQRLDIANVEVIYA